MSEFDDKYGFMRIKLEEVFSKKEYEFL